MEKLAQILGSVLAVTLMLWLVWLFARAVPTQNEWDNWPITTNAVEWVRLDDNFTVR